MRIEQLEYVAAVATHGSLRRAGEHLHVSQPALSEAITKLERELGVTLLDRKRSGARISPVGRSLMPYLNDVLDALARLKHAASGHTGAGRAIRVGTVNTGTSHVLLPAARDHRHSPFPAPIEIRQLQQEEIELGLLEGTLDLGLINLLDEDDTHPDLDAIELMTGTPVAVIPANHPLAARSSVSPADLLDADFISMREGYLMHRVAKRLFGAAVPPAVHATDGADMGTKMVGSGLGVTILPNFSVLDDPLLVAGAITTRPISVEPVTVRMMLISKRGARQPETVRALSSTLQARAANQIS